MLALITFRIRDSYFENVFSKEIDLDFVRKIAPKLVESELCVKQLPDHIALQGLQVTKVNSSFYIGLLLNITSKTLTFGGTGAGSSLTTIHRFKTKGISWKTLQLIDAEEAILPESSGVKLNHLEFISSKALKEPLSSFTTRVSTA